MIGCILAPKPTRKLELLILPDETHGLAGNKLISITKLLPRAGANVRFVVGMFSYLKKNVGYSHKAKESSSNTSFSWIIIRIIIIVVLFNQHVIMIVPKKPMKNQLYIVAIRALLFIVPATRLRSLDDEGGIIYHDIQ